MDIWAPWELPELGEDNLLSTENPKDPIYDLGVFYCDTLKKTRFWLVVYLLLENV